MKDVYAFGEEQQLPQNMLLTTSTRFGMPKVEAQTLSDKPWADPRTIIEAYKRPDAQKWIEAANVEWENLIAHDAFVWVDPPQESQIISSTMVFKKKVDQDENLEKYKARLCATGDQQKEEDG